MTFDTPEYSLKRIDIDFLLDHAPDSIVSRGLNYFNRRRAQVVSADDLRAVVRVQGSMLEPYTVRIWLDEKHPDKLIHVVCNCPYAEGQNKILCKHKVCALLALQEYFDNNSPRGWTAVLNDALSQKNNTKKSTGKNLLFFVIGQSYYEQQISPYVIPKDSFGPDLPKEMDTIAEMILERKLQKQCTQVTYTRMLSSVEATTSGIAAAKLILENMRFYNFNVSFDALMPLIANDIVFVEGDRRGNWSRANIILSPAQIELGINRDDNGLRLALQASFDGKLVPLDGPDARIVCEKPAWLMADRLLFPIKENPDMVAELLASKVIKVPADDQQEFLEDYLPALAEQLPVVGDISTQMRDLQVEPVPRVYLSESDGELVAELRFGYDKQELQFEKAMPPHSIKWNTDAGELMRIQRDSEAEEHAWKDLSSFGLKRLTNGTFSLRQSVQPVDFLLHHLPNIAEAGYEIYGEENIKSVRVNRSRPRISLSISSGIDWFDVKAVVNFDGQEVPFAHLRRALKKQEKYIKLSDGSIGEIPEDWLKRYSRLFEAAKESDDGLKLMKSQIMLLDAAMEDADSSEADEEFQRKRDRLKNFNRIEHKELPAGLTGQLRNYQKAGYDWLHFLHDYEFGGCLADDMGIGKTIQALALLQSLHESGHARSADLVIVPRSLLENWARESAKFAPGLRVLIHADQDRTEEVEEFSNFDLILTTYGVMLRDIDALVGYNFHYVILDESQTIKNPLSLTAKAARRLKSDHKLVLTGTPVENSTVELWSQFAFLNPGMLGSLDYFKDKFVSAIERQNDKNAANNLREMVRPFILRRTKELVTPELPPMTERIIYCEMNPAQLKFYNRTREEYRSMLLGMIESSGMQNARMKVLEGLLRLRQICNHPRLIDKNSRISSAKLETLMDMLETLWAEGHKALIFSQFTQMLKIIELGLDLRRCPYLYLDGRTKKTAGAG